MPESSSRPAGDYPAGSGSRLLRRREPPGQRGMVTAELAFASLGAALACMALAWVLALVGLLLRCHETAVNVARQEARGDLVAVDKAMAGRPPNARVTISRDGQLVRVRVDLAARPWADWLPTVPLGATAAVQQEPA